MTKPMDNHCTEVSWIYAVPSNYHVRIVITQRRDGSFNHDPIGGRGQYYVHTQHLRHGQWEHCHGSTSGGYASFEIAYAVTTGLWEIATGLRGYIR